MRLEAGQIYLSASDLMRFQGCSHATALDVRYLQGKPLTPVEDSADAKLVQEKGELSQRQEWRLTVFTDHAQTRCQQRGIPRNVVEKRAA